MARSEINTEFNTFVGGILTEANPINYPVGYTLDEENFILERNGTRRRRPGLDVDSSLNDFNDKAATEFVDNGSTVVTDIQYKDYFIWENATFPSGLKDVLVLLYTFKYSSGTRRMSAFLLYDLSDIKNISDNFIDSFYLYDVSASDYPNGAVPRIGDVTGIATYKGSLVLCEYSKLNDSFSYLITPVTSNTTKGTDTLVIEPSYLLVRNYVGDSGTNISITTRPSSLTDDHAYNLYNRGWTSADVTAWNTFDSSYPSLADSPVFSKNKGSSYSTSIMDATLFGNSSAPRGKAIVNVFDVGGSFISYSGSIFPGTPSSGGDFYPRVDSDFKGNVVSAIETAGRVMYLSTAGEYKGFGSTVLTYNAVGQSDPNVFGHCYSTNDPTSEAFNTPLDTDGGLIDMSEIGYPLKISASRSKIMTFGTKGIFEVYSPSGIFKPSDLTVRKVSNSILSFNRELTNTLEGPTPNNINYYETTAKSVTVAGDSFLYWSDSGINILTNNPQNDSFSEASLSDTSIKTLFNTIPNICKAFAKGVYIPEDNSVCWAYSLDSSNPDRYSYLLIYDITLQAWYKFRFANTDDAYIVGMFLAPVDATTVDIPQYKRLTFLCQTTEGFLHANFTDSGVFSDYNNSTDANEVQAFMQTGYLNANNSSLEKQATYIVPSFLRTEDGFTDDGSGNLTPTNQSSCLISAWWDYVDDASLPKANDTFEAYKYNRLYIPSDASDTFDYGQTVLTSKNRLTGRGRALSLRFETSEGKDCRLLGWNLGFGANAKV